MANFEHVGIIEQGNEVWNDWRKKNPEIIVDLSGAILFKLDLYPKRKAPANLSNVNLSNTLLMQANLNSANLTGANLAEANLGEANLDSALLDQAVLNGAYLVGTNFTNAKLRGAELTGAILGSTVFGNTDLTGVKGLELCQHFVGSVLDHSTLRKSGNLPLNFLRGCGLPDILIEYIPSLVNNPIEFFSCFISYSHKDEEFARRLYSRMREANLRVWYAPEEMKGGRKLHEQIFNAIQIHDKLLLILSEHSLQSEWVMTEIRRARKAEREENRRKLFPIKLVDFDAIQKWECFDADSGKDLAVEMREYFIPDFSNWKDHDSFEKAFDRLLRDLKDEEDKTSRSNAALNELYDRAVLSPRNTFKEEWEQVTSSIVEIAKRNGLINGEGVDASQVVNKLFETEIVSEAIKEKFYSLKKWHFNVVVFAGSPSEEPQSAINFVKMARELQKAIDTACANNRIVENRKTGRPPKVKAESSKASKKGIKK